MRIICGYNPCRSKRQDNSTSYLQQRRYQIWQHHDHITCPRVKFREDLGKLLKEWRAAGDRLIVCLNANENIYTQALGKILTDPQGLGMIEAVGRYTGKKDRHHILSGSAADQRDLDYPRRNSFQRMYNASRVWHWRPQAIYHRSAHCLTGGTRSTKRTSSSIKTAQYAPTTRHQKIHREPGRKPVATPTN